MEANLDEGREFVTARRTIAETDIVNYAGLSNDFNPLHVDEVFAREHGFGRRIAHGQLIASIVTGLRSELDDWPVISYLGASRRFTGAVGAGDTISCRYRIASVRTSGSDGRNQIVTLDLSVVDEGGQEVMSGGDTLLVRQGIGG
jgi:acyl dehydratase